MMDNYLTALGDIKESVISVFHARCVSDSAILNTVNCNLFMSVYNYWYCNLFGWLLVLSSPVSLLIIIDAFFPSLICVSPLFLNYPYFLLCSISSLLLGVPFFLPSMVPLVSLLFLFSAFIELLLFVPWILCSLKPVSK